MNDTALSISRMFGPWRVTVHDGGCIDVVRGSEATGIISAAVTPEFVGFFISSISDKDLKDAFTWALREIGGAS